MCGRYTLSRSGAEMAEHFGLPAVPAWSARYNIAPTQDVAVIRQDPATREPVFELRRWGLVPGWAQSAAEGSRNINARFETAHEKKSFREALRRRRCLVPADGFYEWKQEGRRKLPHVMQRPDRGLFAMAGLYEHWEDAEGHPVESVTILTTEAAGPVARIHGRMPVILAPASYAAWLDTGWDGQGARERFRGEEASQLAPRPVGKRVGDVRNDDPGCLELDPLPLFDEPEPQD